MTEKALSVAEAVDDGHADPMKRCKQDGCLEDVHRAGSKGVWGSYCQKHGTERCRRGRSSSSKHQGMPRDTDLVRAARRIETIRKREAKQRERVQVQVDKLKELVDERLELQEHLREMLAPEGS